MSQNMKTNQKSIRMTDEVYSYVDKFKGNGFNEKFENLVLFCLKEEKEVKKRIDYQLDLEKQNQKKIDKQRKVLQDLERISRTVDSLLVVCNNSECNSKFLQQQLEAVND